MEQILEINAAGEKYNLFEAADIAYQERQRPLKKNIAFILPMALINVFLFASCSSIQAGIYLVSIDEDNGETILQNEPNVITFLENVIASSENYSIKAFSRTGVNFQLKRSKFITHSYYVFFNDNEEYHTLSFYGTKVAFHSEGAWALDTDSDMGSYKMYLEGKNRWDVEEIFTESSIDVRKTARNILDKIDSGITYYYKDHITNKPDMDNCNTALWETIVLEDRM